MKGFCQKHTLSFWLVAFVVLCVNHANAQVFLVGDTTCNYMRANKTFTDTCPPLIFNLFPMNSDGYSFDVDGDAISDINVQSYCSTYGFGSGNAFMKEGIHVSSATGAEFATSDTCFTSGNLALNTPLNASLTWTNTRGSLYYYWYHYTPAYSMSCGVQANPFRFGFRKVISGDTIYGWVLMDTNFPGKFISYAFSSPGTIVNPVFTNTNSTICAGQTLTLTASPSGGTFNGAGVSVNVFSSSVPGTFPVYYTNGCVNSATLNITVNPLPNPVFTNTLTTLCPGDSLVLQASPVGGTFSGTAVSGNVFHAGSTGTTTVFYASTNTYGCSKTASLNITVAICTGISELNQGTSSFLIFPNPANGEFEIKGTKEETVFITNELGQTFCTKHLNVGMNFTEKVSDLQSGIYFVGNTFHRQKVVVIR